MRSQWNKNLLPVASAVFGILGVSSPVMAQYAPSSVVDIKVWCEGSNTGERVPNCSLTASTIVSTRSNAHFHTGGGQPSSKLGASRSGPFSTSLTVNTGSSGITTIWLKTHQIGQFEGLRLCAPTRCTLRPYYIGYSNFQLVPENSL